MKKEISNETETANSIKDAVKSSAWVIFETKNKTIMWVSLTEDGAKSWIKEMTDAGVLLEGECVYESVPIV